MQKISDMTKSVIAFFLSSKKRMALGLLFLAIIVFGCWKIFFNKSAAPQYQTAQVEKGTLVSSVSAYGTITTGASSSIVTQASGVVTRVYVKNGDTVARGQKIADLQLDQASEQKRMAAWASYLSAKNSLASAQNSLNSLNSAMWKAQQTFENGAVAKGLTTDDPIYIQQNSDWIKAENDYKNQQNVIAQTQAALSAALLSYNQTASTIVAPSGGVVNNLILTPGLAISTNGSSSSSNSTSSTTTALGTITLPQGGLQATVNVSEIDATKIVPAQKVTVTLDAFPDKTFTGSILSLNTNGVVSSGVTTYPATIAIDSALNTIYPNMAVSAKIITNVKDSVLLVPPAAVQTTAGQTTVRELQNGQLIFVPVTVGDSNDFQTEIISGVNEGDTIVTSVTSTNRTITTGTTSPFSSFGGGNRGFGGGGGTTIIRRGG